MSPTSPVRPELTSLQEPINLARAVNVLCPKCRTPITIPLIVDAFSSMPAVDGPGDVLFVDAKGHAYHDCPGVKGIGRE